MISKFKEAKENKSVLHFKNFQEPQISWEDVLKFIFEEAEIQNPDLQSKSNLYYRMWDLGNIQIQNKLWLAPQTKNIFSKFNGVSELLYKVNGDKEDKKCDMYNGDTCNCEVVWHIQGMRISLAGRYVSDHKDPHDILYWQVLGTSFWKINNDKIYELNPGDLLYFSREDSHAVWCTEPRAGIIIDGVGLMTKS